VVSFRRYEELFRVPGLAAAYAASVIGRLPIGVAGLAILLFVQTTSQPFVQAGTASALYVLGLSVVAPLVGRLIDRAGPRRVLVVCSAIYPAALLLLVGLVTHAQAWLWIGACAFVAGAALPPITICMRALFPRIIAQPAVLPTAYAVDSALIELIFIIGPVLVAVCVGAGLPALAVVAAALSAVAGTLIFLRTSVVRQWSIVPGAAARPTAGPLRSARLLLVFAITLSYSLAFGLFEVAVTAYAAQRGAPAAAGIALALASGGSAVGALIYGGRHWPWPLPRQFVLSLFGMATAMLVLVPLERLPLFAAGCVVAGAPMATVIAVQSLLVSQFSPRTMLAESFTWSTTCLLGGISAGIAAGGMLAERVAPQAILLIAAAATALGAFGAMLLKDGKRR
jgi:MFS family permease